MTSRSRPARLMRPLAKITSRVKRMKSAQGIFFLRHLERYNHASEWKSRMDIIETRGRFAYDTITRCFRDSTVARAENLEN